MVDSVRCIVKQKAAYEMRISDWSSDVCSSDLCLSPGSARYVFRGGYDARCIAAELVDMAIRGHLQVGREARVVGFRWRVQRLPDASTEGLMPIPRALAERLFARGGQVFELTENTARRMAHGCEGSQAKIGRAPGGGT